MTDWTYSHKRLAQLDADLERIGAEIDALPFEDQRKNATRELAESLGAEWARLTDERDRCAMALWRRSRNRSRTT